MVKKNYHPFSTFQTTNRLKVGEGKLPDQEKLDLCKQHLIEKAADDYCVNRKTNKNLKCSCLKILKDNEDAIMGVAVYMFDYYTKRTPEERARIVIDWCRYARDPNDEEDNFNFSVQRKDYFFIPFNANEDSEWKDELGNHKICKTALGAILDIGADKWATYQEHVLSNTVPQHGNKGKKGSKACAFDTFVKTDLRDFLQEMIHHAQPRSTKCVRDETGLAGLSFDQQEKDWLDLPSHWSKRSLYERFMEERGWKVRTLADGTLRLDPKVEEPDRSCSWSTFWNFWKTEFPNLRVQRPSEDVCGHCHMFYNRFRMLKSSQCEPCEDEDAGEDDDDGETAAMIIDEGEPVEEVITIDTSCSIKRKVKDKQGKQKLKKVHGKVVGLPEEGSIYFNVKFEDANRPEQFARADLMKLLPSYHIAHVQARETIRPSEVPDEKEKMLAEAALHVKQADAQRAFTNEKKAAAEADARGKVKHEDRTYCLIADYSQSEQLPYFGQEQPGETYYYSPLKINIFGIVDCSNVGGKLSAHVYHEGEGKKGGNNVASLLLKELDKQGWLQEDKTGKELVICMDNCGGQNKNNHVLRLALYLVERKFFGTVIFNFYIVGHTKNACDRWFNSLKKVYRESNLYTYDQLIDAYSHKEIIIRKVDKQKDFVDFLVYCGQFYKTFDPGTIKENHIFSVSSSAPTEMRIQRDNLPGSPEHVQDFAIKKPSPVADRFNKLKSTPMEIIGPPGIPGIKQVELYEKFRPLLPQQFRNVTCPYPGDEIMENVRGTRKVKARERQEKKRKADSMKSNLEEDIAPSDGNDTSIDGQKTSGWL